MFEALLATFKGEAQDHPGPPKSDWRDYHLVTVDQMNRLYRILGLPECAKGGERVWPHIDRLLDYLEASRR